MSCSSQRITVQSKSDIMSFHCNLSESLTSLNASTETRRFLLSYEQFMKVQLQSEEAKLKLRLINLKMYILCCILLNFVTQIKVSYVEPSCNVVHYGQFEGVFDGHSIYIIEIHSEILCRFMYMPMSVYVPIKYQET